MTKTIRLTTAQAIVRFLNEQYIDIDGEVTPFVEGVFGVFGHGNVLSLGAALQEDPGHLKVYQGHNEQGMASAATAFAREKLRHKIFAVTASAGPGSANFVTAMGMAYSNSIPLLVFPADTYASRQPDPVLQQIEIENSTATTTNDALKPLSVYWDRIQRPEQIMSALLKGFEFLTNPAKTGPVVICLPQDAEAEAYDYPESFFQKRIYSVKRIGMSDTELSGALEIIRNSRKPVVVIGGGAKYSQAGDALRHFAIKHKIPLVETPSGKSTVEWGCEYVLGGTGVLGTSAANNIVAESDLIIGAGTRYTDFTTASKTAIPGRTTVININLSRQQALKFDAFPVVADVRDAIKLLDEKLGDYQSEFTDIKSEKELWNEERQRLSQTDYDSADFTPEVNQYSDEKMAEYANSLGTHLTQTAALIKVNDLIADDAIMISAAGSLPGDVHRLWNAEIPNTYHMEYGYSLMGYEVPAALGARLADPSREVYALVGDGSFIMLHSELVTALQYDKKINIIVFDNSGFHSINNLQMGQGHESFRTEFRTSDDKVMRIDYAKIGEGYGAKTYSVNTIEELEAAIEDAKKQTTSTLIDIKVLPKTMTHGYSHSWWRVGNAELSSNKKVVEMTDKNNEILKDAFKY